jgi:hypothetical protein
MTMFHALSLGVLIASAPLPLLADEFFTHPELLQAGTRYGTDLAYFADDALQRLPSYQNVMIDEPVIFIAKDSPYTGFKASDLAAVSDMLRQGLTKGLQEEPMQSGKLQVVDQAGPATLYLRIGIQNVYIRKNKRGLFAYTPVGAVAHGVSSATKEAVDKTTLVEMQIQSEVLDSQTNEVLAAFQVGRGQHEDKGAHTEEEAAGWEAIGQLAEIAGRRMACRFDNGRLPESQRRDCIKEIPVPR